MFTAWGLCSDPGQPPLSLCVPTSGVPRLGEQKRWGISQGWGKKKDYALSGHRVPPTS